MTLDAVLEQPEATLLLRAALAEGVAHAYLFYGPAGVGKRETALAFAGAVLGDPGRAARRAHPDLYVLEPLGDQIRIDEIRELRRDLHMRPFEANRRVYLVFGAQLMNAEAADALLKDLEEPPPYAVVVLVADELGPLPETIRSRCQLVAFRRLSERAIRARLQAEAPGLAEEEATVLARVAGGRLDRMRRLLDDGGSRRRRELLGLARSVYLDPGFDPIAAAAAVQALAGERAREAKEAAEREVEQLELPPREAELRVRRAERGAEREEVLLALDELAAWYRDLVVLAAGARGAVFHLDGLHELAADASIERMFAAEAAAEAIRETWRTFEEFNVSTSLALESLFVRLRRELAGVGS